MDSRVAYSTLSSSVDGLLGRCATFGAALVDGASVDQGAALDANLGSFWETHHQLLQRKQTRTFTVAVLALAKSGKSTFLNSLIGAPLLPVSNVPETARICSIRHTPEQRESVLRDSGVVISGEAAIQRHLATLNREVRTREHQITDEVLLRIDLAFPALAAQDTQHDVVFELLDTPGPNEEGEEALKFQVERLLDSTDAILYLLDYTKLRTAEEASLFGRLKTINPNLIRRLSRRLFFVVNKIDASRTSEGMNEDETRDYVSHLVTAQLGGDFQLRPEQVLLVSAHEALLSRLMLRPDVPPSDRTLAMFKERAFGSSRAVQKRKFTAAEFAEAATDMGKDSGMQEVEATIFCYLHSHAGALKLMAVVDDVARMLNQMHNSALVSEGSLLKHVDQLRDETTALQTQLADTLQRFDDVQAQTDALEAEVVDEVRTRLFFLQERLTEHVSAVIDGAMLADTAPPPGRWRAIFEKARAFLGQRNAGTGRAELQTVLSELQKDIFRELDTEVRGFWHDLETATNERQRALLRRLNTHLEGLSRAIEAVVSEQLAVRLEPVDLRLTPPSAVEFHNSLQTLFTEGITQKQTVHERQRQVTDTVWEKRYRNGICRLGEYYVGRPSTRTVTEAYTKTEFEIEPLKIKAYFSNLIGKTIENSVQSVRSYVHQYLASMLDTARSSITSYAERFTSSMLAGLQSSEQGEKARLAALEHVRHHIADLRDLLSETAALQEQAEALFPAAAASISHVCSLQFDDEDLYSAEGDADHEDAAAAAAVVDAEATAVRVAETAPAGHAATDAATEAGGQAGQPLTAAALATAAGSGARQVVAAVSPEGSLTGDSLIAPSMVASPGGVAWVVHCEHAAPEVGSAAATAASKAAVAGGDGEEIPDFFLTGSIASRDDGRASSAHSMASLASTEASTQYADMAASVRSLAASWPEVGDSKEQAPAPAQDVAAQAHDPFQASAESPVLAAPADAAFTRAAAALEPQAAPPGLHCLTMSAPVPATVPVYESLARASGGCSTNDDSPRGGGGGELATIPLHNSAPVSPAASVASSSADGWTVVSSNGDQDAEQMDVAAERRRLSEC